jgi:hypothetical protein
MSVAQTVDIPENHRLVIDVPREVPAGKSILTFKPVNEAFDPIKGQEAIERCSGLAKRMGANLSSDEFLEMRWKDRELEDRLAPKIT